MKKPKWRINQKMIKIFKDLVEALYWIIRIIIEINK